MKKTLIALGSAMIVASTLLVLQSESVAGAPTDTALLVPDGVTIICSGYQQLQTDPASGSSVSDVALLGTFVGCESGEEACVQSNCGCGQPPEYHMCCDATCVYQCVPEGTCCP